MTSYRDHISGPDYVPSNVRIEDRPERGTYRYIVVDFDGTDLQAFSNRADAESRRNVRRGVIRAALTRRANKARSAQS
jgi:glucan biosynthesis protein